MSRARRPWPAVLLACGLAAACGGGAFQSGSPDGGAQGDGAKEAQGDDSPIGAPDGAYDGTVHEGSSGDGPQPVDGATDGAEASSAEGGGAEAGTETGTAETGPTDAIAEGPIGCPTETTCAPVAPGGWTGPISFYFGANASPSCPNGGIPIFTGGTGLTAAQASCSTCSCGGAVSCGDPTVTVGLNTCGSSCASGTSTTTCTALSGTCAAGAGLDLTITAPLPSATSCSPSTQTPTLPPAVWSDNALGCPLGAPATCGAGNLCVPTPPSIKACIYQAGSGGSCPSPFTSEQSISVGISDTRSCSSCTCGADPSATCGNGAVEFGSIATCTGVGTVKAPSACAVHGTTSGTTYYTEVVTALTPSDTTCLTTGGGQPNGSVSAIDPVTVCCLP